MRIRSWLLLAFVVVPIIEIALFISVGAWIGFWPTMAVVILTAVIGSLLVSRQGRATWLQFRRELDAGGVPAVPAVHGAMILVGGALLLTPGFLTDVIGLLLLIPAVREAIRVWGSRRLTSRWIVIR
jgi:UPF0716 protein FxsA